MGGNREQLPGKEKRYKGKDALMSYGYKVFPVLLFHTNIQYMAITRHDKLII